MIRPYASHGPSTYSIWDFLAQECNETFELLSVDQKKSYYTASDRRGSIHSANTSTFNNSNAPSNVNYRNRDRNEERKEEDADNEAQRVRSPPPAQVKVDSVDDEG